MLSANMHPKEIDTTNILQIFNKSIWSNSNPFVRLTELQKKKKADKVPHL